jgi:hypothetical protein
MVLLVEMEAAGGLAVVGPVLPTLPQVVMVSRVLALAVVAPAVVLYRVLLVGMQLAMAVLVVLPRSLGALRTSTQVVVQVTLAV